MSAAPSAIPEPGVVIPFGRRREVTETPGKYGANERRTGADAGRFVMLPYALMSAGLSPQAFYTFAWLRRHDGDEGCFPGYDALATEMGCSLRSAKAHVAELEQKGFLAHRRRGRGHTNTYTLYPEGDAPRPEPPTHSNDVQDSAPYTDEVQPVARPEVQNSAPVEVQNSARLTRTPRTTSPGTKSSSSPAREATPSKPRAGRPQRQTTMFPAETPPEVNAVLATLGLEVTEGRIKGYAAVMAEFPDANYQIAAGKCAEWCERMERPPTPGTFRTFCAGQSNETQANGVSSARTNTTGPESAPSRSGVAADRRGGGAVRGGVARAVEGPPAPRDEWSERARRKLRELQASRAAEVPGVRVADQAGGARVAPDGDVGA